MENELMRNDLIRRGDAIDLCVMAIDDSWEYDYAEDRMFEIPAVDAVEVVRKPVKGYEGYYEVDCLGRVYSLDRVITVNDNGRVYDKPVSGKVMGQTVKSHGYKAVTLTKDGICKEFYVHRLVAEAFIPNPDGLPMVNHKDEDKTNNYAENLEWCTNEYNVNYGTAKERRAKKIRGCVSPHAVIVEAFGEKRTRKEWGEMYGVDPHNIERRMSRGWDAEKAITTPLMKNQYAFRGQRREDGLYESLKRGLEEAIAYEKGGIECRKETREDGDNGKHL